MKESKNLGLGTAAIGRPTYINIKQDKETAPFFLPSFRKKGMQVLDEAYQRGVRHFDTAPGYGLAEGLLAGWLQKVNDPSITVSTKWGYTYVANFDPKAKQHEIKEHSLAKLNAQWERSQFLLPYLKVYQIHSATLETGVLENGEILNRLHQLKKENKLIIGLSTTGAHQVEVLKKALTIEVAGEKLFQSFQCTFNVLDQSIGGLKKELEQLKGPFIIKEALANGRLIPNSDFNGYAHLYKSLDLLATKYQVGADAVALRYCMDRFPNAIVLSGANNSIHLEANLKANNFTLTSGEIEQMTDFGISPKTYWQERKALSWN